MKSIPRSTSKSFVKARRADLQPPRIKAISIYGVQKGLESNVRTLCKADPYAGYSISPHAALEAQKPNILNVSADTRVKHEEEPRSPSPDVNSNVPGLTVPS